MTTANNEYPGLPISGTPPGSSNREWLDTYLLTEVEFVRLTKVSPAKAQRDRVNCTGCPYIKVGRSVRYRLADVITWLNQQSQHQSVLKPHTSKSNNNKAQGLEEKY